MPKPAVYMALRQLALSLSKTLVDASVVFDELAKEEPEGVGAALLSDMIGKAEQVQEAAMAAIDSAPEPPPLPLPIAAAVPAPEKEAALEPDIHERYSPIAVVARDIRVSEIEIRRQIAVGKVKKYTSNANMDCVYRSEVQEALRARTRRLKPLPDGLITVTDVAAELGVSTGQVYVLIREGAIESTRDPETSRIGVGREILDRYKRWKRIPDIQPLEQRPVQTANEREELETRLVAILTSLEEEVGQLESCLAEMSPLNRTATLSGWAGNARKVLFEEPADRIKERAWILLEKLRVVARSHRVWVAALFPEWEIESWDLYVRATAAVKEPLSKLEEEIFEEGNLRALLTRPNDVSKSLAGSMIEQARLVLGDANGLLFQARRRFGFSSPPAQLALVSDEQKLEYNPEPINHLVKLDGVVDVAEELAEPAVVTAPENVSEVVAASQPTMVVATEEEVAAIIEEGLRAEPVQSEMVSITTMKAVPEPTSDEIAAIERLIPVPDHIVAKTQGKRMLIVGGQGAREAHRENYLERFQLRSCEWFTQEKSSSSLLRLVPKVTLKNYDIMVFLAGYTSHKSQRLITTARRNKLPVVTITRGYSVSSVAHAIEGQYTDPLTKALPIKKLPSKPIAKVTPIKKKTVTKRPAERRHHA